MLVRPPGDLGRYLTAPVLIVDALYAISLLVSLAAGSVSMMLGLAAHFSLRGETPPDRARPGAPKAALFVRVATGLLVLSGIAGLTSFVVHSRWGHGEGSVAPMTVSELVRAHPSFLVAGLLIGASAVLVWAARAKIASRARIGNAA